MDARIEESTNAKFNNSALEAVRQWTFKSGIKDGRAVKSRVRLPMIYDLEAIEACEIDELDEIPEIIHRVAPVYPGLMKRLRKRATVRLSFVVDESGRVIDPVIFESTNAQFNESALVAIRQWEFKPGIKDGVPVKTRVKIPFKYTLRR